MIDRFKPQKLKLADPSTGKSFHLSVTPVIPKQIFHRRGWQIEIRHIKSTGNRSFWAVDWTPEINR